MILLQRKPNVKSAGMVGVLTIGKQSWPTMEQPWNNNQPFKSCVPCGEYELVPWTSAKYGECFVAVNEVLNVFHSETSPGRPDNGRFKCLYFHRGNFPSNFQGCGGVGALYLPEKDMITNTKETCKEVNQLIGEEGSFKLRIEEV